MSAIDQIWRETCARLAARPAIHLEPSGRAWTFADLEAAVGATSLDPSELAPCAAGNTPEFIAAFLAARRAGKVFVALDRSMPAPVRDAAVARLGALELPRDTAMVKLTSGSTAEPRGIALSEANLLASARNIMATMGIGRDEINFAAISLAHSYGFDNLVLPLVFEGAAMVLLESFYPGTVLEALARRRPTFVPLVPIMYESLAELDGDWSSVRRCISAGAPLEPALAARFHARTGRKIHAFYGSTECGGITFDRSDDPEMPAGCVGTALDGVGVDLTSEGRVRVRSAAVALASLPEDEVCPLGPGTFLTRDVGRFDGEGHLILTGRASEVINVAGRKVAPAEIEACLLALAGVRAAIVIGISDPRRGESIGALVAAPGLDESRLLAHCRQNLPAWKVPRLMRVVERLPHNERGKVSREAVHSLLER